MLFYKYVCEYTLKEITTSQLIDVAIDCVSSGIESDNLYILAGLNISDEYDILLYYKLALEELNFNEPTEFEAVKYLIKYYCHQLIDKKITPEAFLYKIVKEIGRKYTAPNSWEYTNAAGYTFDLMKEETKYIRDILDIGDYLDWKNIEYAGDFWGIEHFEGIYWRIGDFREYSSDYLKRFYGIDEATNVEKLVEDLYKSCYEEAEKYLKNNIK